MGQSMTIQLLDGRYAPITSEIGFLECDARTAAEAFLDWHGPIQKSRGVRLDRREISGDLPSRIQSLLPLTSVEARRFLFLPTIGAWAAYLDNGWRGPDVFSAVSYLCQKIGCRGVRATSVPHTRRRTPSGQKGRDGATILEMYEATTIGCSFLNIRRSISAANDGGKWRFDLGGEPLPFEQPERYQARQIRDRFTPELLEEYLMALGINLFQEQFYTTAEVAHLISKVGPCANGLEEFSLQQVQAES